MKSKTLYLIFLPTLLLLGIFTKIYSGIFAKVINQNLGGLFYVTFGVLLFSLILPKLPNKINAILAFLITTVLEFLQLWHHQILEYFRSNLIGRTILGNSFSWLDIPWYAAGALVGFWLLNLKQKQ